MNVLEKITKETATTFRVGIKALAKEVWGAKNAFIKEPKADDPEQRELDGEIIANFMLAYRHLEDASMRLGKVIQAAEGGQSVYDATEQPTKE